MGQLGTREADVNLAVAIKIGEELRRENISPIFTRTKDVSVSLKKRVTQANTAGAAAFVSVHCNSAGDAKAHGTEAYHYTGSAPGKRLAAAMNRRIYKATGLFNRGVKSAGFYVLRRTEMPAALIELAFISNEKEERLLGQEEFQTKIARAIAEGVVEYLKDAHLSC